MKFDDAVKVLDGIPYTSPAKRRLFYDLVKDNGIQNIFELGTAHRVSACYMVAALDGKGHIDAVEVKSEVFNLSPKIGSVAKLKAIARSALIPGF